MFSHSSIRLVTAFVISLLLIDLAIRLVEPWTSDTLAWPGGAQQKAEELSLLEPGELEEIVVVGSSAVGAGVAPAVVETTLGCGVRVRNEGVPEAGPIAVEEYLDVAVLPAGTPRHVVFGLTPRDFSTPFYGEAYIDGPSTDASPLVRLEYEIRDYSALVRHRTFLRNPRLWPFVRSAADDLEEVGDPDGLSTFGVEFAPAADQEAALIRTITVLQDAGISPVLVSFGVTEAELARWGDPQVARVAFDDYLASLAATTSTVHISTLDVDEPALYGDTIHLNEVGRETMSVALGERLGPIICG